MTTWAVCVRDGIAYPKSAGNCPRHDVELSLYNGPFGAQRWVPWQADYSVAHNVIVRIQPYRGAP